LRNYQIAPNVDEPEAPPQLVEVGPRLALQPVRIFEGSLKGAVIWKNHVSYFFVLMKLFFLILFHLLISDFCAFLI
jgi:hypothetical protein